MTSPMSLVVGQDSWNLGVVFLQSGPTSFLCVGEVV